MSDVEDLWRKLFQSTLPQGERHFLSAHDKNDFFISIHAPTRGATVFRKFQMTTQVYFNPRSHKGSDFFWNPFSIKVGYFNPRSHKGSDENTIKLVSMSSISIHAPTRGATCAVCDILANDEFQSTLPQGERPSRR